MRFSLSDRRRWAAGDPSAGPVWPPVDDTTGQAQIVRVERQIHEVVETVGTPEQINRSGVFGQQHGAPGHRGPGAHEV